MDSAGFQFVFAKNVAISNVYVKITLQIEEKTLGSWINSLIGKRPKTSKTASVLPFGTLQITTAP